MKQNIQGHPAFLQIFQDVILFFGSKSSTIWPHKRTFCSIPALCVLPWRWGGRLITRGGCETHNVLKLQSLAPVLRFSWLRWLTRLDIARAAALKTSLEARRKCCSAVAWGKMLLSKDIEVALAVGGLTEAAEYKTVGNNSCRTRVIIFVPSRII